MKECINISGVTEEKRKQTHSLSRDADLGLLDELWADLEPFTIPAK